MCVIFFLYLHISSQKHFGRQNCVCLLFALIFWSKSQTVALWIWPKMYEMQCMIIKMTREIVDFFFFHNVFFFSRAQTLPVAFQVGQ